MKKKISLLLLTLLTVYGFSFAQSFTIGTGAITNPTNDFGPMRTNATASQWNTNTYIYPASLISGITFGDKINSIEFKKVSNGAITGPVLCKIWLKYTAAADLGSGDIDWATLIASPSTVLCYNGDITTIPGGITGTGFFKIPFTSGFQYVGDNIQVMVQYTQTNAQANTLLWGCDNATTVPAYSTLQGKYAFGTGTIPAFPLLTINNAAHPQIKFNYTFGNDLSVTTITTPPNNSLLSTNTTYFVRVNVKNEGARSQSDFPIFYTVDNGTPIGPENIIYSGGLFTPNDQTVRQLAHYTPLTGGYHTIKAYTKLASDQNTSNDTATSIILATPINTFPLMVTFSPIIGWTANGNIWGLINGVKEAATGVPAGNAVRADFYSVDAGVRDTLMSPTYDFSNNTIPVLSYSVTHKTYTTGMPEPDNLAVIVSANGGTTWSAPLLSKFANGSPSLSTYPLGATSEYLSSETNLWRHEQIDLSAYAGQANVKIGFVAVSGFGNQLYLDNVLVSKAVAHASQNITLPGVQPTLSGVTLNFSTIIPNGKAKVSKFTGVPPNSTFKVNTNATTNNGAIFTPNNVSSDFWYTVTYDSLATYSISIDISTLTNAPLPQELYILKRSVQNEAWTALSTTLSGNRLTASGLTSFSDFAIGSRSSSNALPISMVHFTGNKTGTANQLSWVTQTEINNRGFDLQKSTDGSQFSTLGFIASKAINGNSATQLSYAFTDNSPATTTYYRLKIIGTDGRFTYSPIVKLSQLATGQLTLHPNPVTNQALLQYTSTKTDKVTITVIDAIGKIVLMQQQTVTTGTNAISLATTGFAAGVYTVEVQGSNGKAVVRMVKE